MHSLSLGASALVIPFSERDGPAARLVTQPLWVEASDAEGHAGYGEASPRVCATGRCLDAAIAFVRQHGDAWCDQISDIESLRKWVDLHAADIDAHPAAWCAVELALLDLFAQRRGVSLETMLNLRPLSGQSRYTAVVADVREASFAWQLKRCVAAGVDDYKIKLCGALDRDRTKVRALRAAGIAPSRVRADATALWSSAREAVFYLRMLGYRFAAVEEPVAAGAVHEMAEIGRALGCAIVLDETVSRLGDLASLPGGARFIVNLHVSKMGGLLRTLALARAAVAQGLPLIVGAHVGETAVLTRVALALVQAHREHVLAVEGGGGWQGIAPDGVARRQGAGASGVLDDSAA